MGSLKHFLKLIVVVLLGNCLAFADKQKECTQKCDPSVFGVRLGHVKNGTSVCIMNDDHPRTNVINGEEPCFINCLGQSVPDQAKCWCEYCKFLPEHFCAKPYGKSIQEEECDALVCSGKGDIKYRYYWCLRSDGSVDERAKQDEDEYGI